MDLALKQYQTLLQKKVWGEESSEHREIMSLLAQIVTLQKKLQGTVGNNNRTDKFNKSSTENNMERLSAEEYRKMRYKRAPKWMKKQPTNLGEKLKHGQYEYTWCTYHKLWQRHTANDCRLNPANKEVAQSTQSKEKNVNKNAKPKMRNEICMAAIGEDDTDSVAYDDENYEESDNDKEDSITFDDNEEDL